MWDSDGHVVLALLIVAVSRKILLGGELGSSSASELAAESVLSVAE